ncbi:MAG: DUF1499 domain-containing protein [Methyloligellaceae bacterium]
MIDFEKLRLKKTPNQYIVAPEGLCKEAEPHRTAPVYPVSAPELQQLWDKFVSKQPRITRKDADEANMKFELVQRTALFRFPDTITVQFIQLSDPNQSTLAIYSRSKYGRSDFGQNKKRINAWLSALHKEL